MIRQIITPLCILTAMLDAAPVFIGTGGNKTSPSKGIYVTDFDSTTGKLTVPTLAAEYQNPGFLALHPTRPFLYACGQPTKPFADGSSSVAAFSVMNKSTLKFLGESSTGGKGACHLAVDASGRTVAVANYVDGSVSTVKLDDDGVPVGPPSVVSRSGSGPNKLRQNGPHAHGVYFDKSNTHLFVPDLGLDQVFVYPFDEGTSKLGTPLPSLIGTPGSGPRHMTFSADEKNAYVINELDNSVLATAYESGKFKSLGTVLTLPQDFAGVSTTAEIEIHPSGSFLYASNRGHNSIAVYRRDEKTGTLVSIQIAPCGGRIPRHFKIDPSGKWLLCAYQDSNAIGVLPINPATGLLGEAAGIVSVPGPICLLFGR